MPSSPWPSRSLVVQVTRKRIGEGHSERARKSGYIYSSSRTYLLWSSSNSLGELFDVLQNTRPLDRAEALCGGSLFPRCQKSHHGAISPRDKCQGPAYRSDKPGCLDSVRCLQGSFWRNLIQGLQHVYVGRSIGTFGSPMSPLCRFFKWLDGYSGLQGQQVWISSWPDLTPKKSYHLPKLRQKLTPKISHGLFMFRFWYVNIASLAWFVEQQFAKPLARRRNWGFRQRWDYWIDMATEDPVATTPQSHTAHSPEIRDISNNHQCQCVWHFSCNDFWLFHGHLVLQVYCCNQMVHCNSRTNSISRPRSQEAQGGCYCTDLESTAPLANDILQREHFSSF